MGDNLYRNTYQVKRSVRVRISLVCGCTALSRNSPMNEKAVYPCPSNMGHGYSVRWASWVDTQTNWARTNKALAEGAKA